MDIKNCYTGTAIEQVEEGCGNNYISTDCIQTPNAITYLDISAGSTQTEINAAITSSLIFKDQQISEISATKIEAGENVEINGIGTEEQPYVINSLGGSQDLQGVIDKGGMAIIDGTTSQGGLIASKDNNGEPILAMAVVSEEFSHTIKLNVSQGLVFEKLDISSGNLTNVLIKDPIANTNLFFPAKQEGEDYTLATTSDFKTINGESIVGTGDIVVGGSTQGLDSVLGVNNTSVNKVMNLLSGDSTQVLQTTPTRLVINQLDQNISAGINNLGGIVTIFGNSSGAVNEFIMTDRVATGIAVYNLNPTKLAGSYTLATTDQLRPYTVYSATLNQTDTDNPIVNTLENSIGNIVWTRITTGMYWGTLVGAFPVDKTHLSITPSSPTGSYSIFRNSDDIIVVKTQDNGTVPFTDSDDKLFNNSIRIEVYN